MHPRSDYSVQLSAQQFSAETADPNEDRYLLVETFGACNVLVRKREWVLLPYPKHSFSPPPKSQGNVPRWAESVICGREQGKALVLTSLQQTHEGLRRASWLMWGQIQTFPYKHRAREPWADTYSQGTLSLRAVRDCKSAVFATFCSPGFSREPGRCSYKLPKALGFSHDMICEVQKTLFLLKVVWLPCAVRQALQQEVLLVLGNTWCILSIKSNPLLGYRSVVSDTLSAYGIWTATVWVMGSSDI